MSTHLLVIIFCFVVIACSIDTSVVKESINDLTSDKDQHLVAALAAYRYRFRHSETFKTLHGIYNDQNYTSFCKACDILVPWVS